MFEVFHLVSNKSGLCIVLVVNEKEETK